MLASLCQRNEADCVYPALVYVASSRLPAPGIYSDDLGWTSGFDRLSLTDHFFRSWGPHGSAN